MMPSLLVISANWDNRGTLGGGWSLRAPDQIPPSIQNFLTHLLRSSASQADIEKYLDPHGVSGWAVDYRGWSLLDVCKPLHPPPRSRYTDRRFRSWPWSIRIGMPSICLSVEVAIYIIEGSTSELSFPFVRIFLSNKFM
jgi:hypothetical protein